MSLMERLLNVEDVAVLLGLSRLTVYAWAARRQLPALKVGSRLKFRASEIQEWVDGRPRPAGAKAGAQAPRGPSAGREEPR